MKQKGKSTNVSVKYHVAFFQLVYVTSNLEEAIKYKTVVTPKKHCTAVYYTCVSGQCTM